MRPTAEQDATRARVWLALINVLGGIAVLGSYVVGIASHPETTGQVWGGVPESLRPVYTISMFTAAAGYFLFTPYVFFSLSPPDVRVFGRYSYAIFPALYACILVPSAVWMPLTFEMIESPGPVLWASIRTVLFLVGLGSVGLVAAIVSAQPQGSSLARRLAILGALLFTWQTAVLDALVWTAYFPF